MYIVFYVSKAINELKTFNIFSSYLVKKRPEWPKYVKGRVHQVSFKLNPLALLCIKRKNGGN